MIWLVRVGGGGRGEKARSFALELQLRGGERRSVCPEKREMV